MPHYLWLSTDYQLGIKVLPRRNCGDLLLACAPAKTRDAASSETRRGLGTGNSNHGRLHVIDFRAGVIGRQKAAKAKYRKKPFTKGLTPSGGRTYTPHPVAKTRRARRRGAGTFFDIVDRSEGMRGRRLCCFWCVHQKTRSVLRILACSRNWFWFRLELVSRTYSL